MALIGQVVSEKVFENEGRTSDGRTDERTDGWLSEHGTLTAQVS